MRILYTSFSSHVNFIFFVSGRRIPSLCILALKVLGWTIRAFTFPIDPASVEKHLFSPNAWECVVDLEIIEVGILGDDFL